MHSESHTQDTYTCTYVRLPVFTITTDGRVVVRGGSKGAPILQFISQMPAKVEAGLKPDSWSTNTNQIFSIGDRSPSIWVIITATLGSNWSCASNVGRRHGEQIPGPLLPCSCHKRPAFKTQQKQWHFLLELHPNTASGIASSKLIWAKLSSASAVCGLTF